MSRKRGPRAYPQPVWMWALWGAFVVIMGALLLMGMRSGM